MSTKKTLGRLCKNLRCDSRRDLKRPPLRFTISTALNEQDYCSLKCEQQDSGAPEPAKGKK